jgi:hypothetical protein
MTVIVILLATFVISRITYQVSYSFTARRKCLQNLCYEWFILFSLLVNLLICAFIFNFQAMSEATFWFTTVVTVIILMIPVLAWRFYFVDVCPTLSDRVRLKQRLALLRYVESLVLSVIVPSSVVSV